MFLNHCVSVKTSLINTKLGDFVNLGVLFLTIANLIIYGLVPSPSRFEIRQCPEFCHLPGRYSDLLISICGHEWRKEL